jgi:hypothetical protein
MLIRRDRREEIRAVAQLKEEKRQKCFQEAEEDRREAQEKRREINRIQAELDEKLQSVRISLSTFRLNRVKARRTRPTPITPTQ